MRFAIVPRYHDLFEEPVPELTDLLSGISSEIVVGLLTLIQAELHLANHNTATQDKILAIFLHRQSQQTQKKFRLNLLNSNRNEENENLVLFIMKYVLEFMHYAFVNYKVFPMTGDDTTPDQDFLLLKAYVVFIEKGNDKDTEIFDHNRHHNDDFFFKTTLPMLSSQYEAAHLVNPFPEMVRGMVLLNYLQFLSPYRAQVLHFLEKRGYTSSWL